MTKQKYFYLKQLKIAVDDKIHSKSNLQQQSLPWNQWNHVETEELNQLTVTRQKYTPITIST